jgi:hypothetical protein
MRGTVPDFKPDGLWQALGRLDRMLERATSAADVASSGSAEVEPYRGLYITADDVQRLVRRTAGEPWLVGGNQPGIPAMPENSRFPWLGETFGLDAIDLDILLIALAPEIDLRYERLFAYLHDDITRQKPSVDLALNLLCASREAKLVARACFAPGSPLIRHRLLRVLADNYDCAMPLLAMSLKVEEPVIRFLLGQPGISAQLHPFAMLDADPSAQSGAIEEALARMLAAGEHAHFYLAGPGRSEKDAAVTALAARCDKRLLSVDIAHAVASQDDFESLLDTLFVEARLQNAVLYLTGFDALLCSDRAAVAQALQTRLDASSGIVVVAAGERVCGPRFRTMTSIGVGAAGVRARRARWIAELREHRVGIDGRDLDELASRFRLSETQIGEAVRSASRQSALSGAAPDLARLAEAARLQAVRDPGVLARKIAPLYRWDDLVLPADQVAQLKEICRQARYRHVVYDDWGFDRKLSLGKGLSALFSGPPGTGKTMAVEVIANDLGLDIYKTDLSQMVSKYIGETEKNIDRLFSEARAGNAILFFDECDALFGKRTTIQDAHDRYANIEIAYLLQKLEEHEGLSILATNLRQNLDVAFTRRLTFIVDFPFPDEASRKRLWQSIWPAQVPRSGDLDLDFMATRFKLAGGAVKNVAVAAAFFAAEEGGELRTEHLLWAMRREIEKSGHAVAESEFGPYGERVEALATEARRD